jgi:hypothetical protein
LSDFQFPELRGVRAEELRVDFGPRGVVVLLLVVSFMGRSVRNSSTEPLYVVLGVEVRMGRKAARFDSRRW